MTEETWFSAKEARELNLCDEILASNRAESFLRLTPQQIITQISAEYQPSKQNVNDLTNEAAELLKLKAEGYRGGGIRRRRRPAWPGCDPNQTGPTTPNSGRKRLKTNCPKSVKPRPRNGRRRPKPWSPPQSKTAHQRCGPRVLPGPVRKRPRSGENGSRVYPPPGRISPIRSAAKTPPRSGRRSSKP